MSFSKYISGIYTGLKSLVGGMMVTWKQFWSKKVTMEYPENRKTLVISDRWRSELIMPHDENNEHACTACGICMRNCPNGTINVISKKVVNEEGKSRVALDKHLWDYGMCTFCNICVISCPSNAIIFNNDFEGAVFDREKLHHQLNHPGSKLREKKKTVPAAPKTPVAPAPEATEATRPTPSVVTAGTSTSPADNKTDNAPKTNPSGNLSNEHTDKENN
ncbi:MAG TPA: NADH-quinone oxidoreductase subunit I [Porphyromonadaceae bacterium]|nr:NADH-quinone oxidoreductase subunit I [Porphyromonadaceae bacterium]